MQQGFSVKKTAILYRSTPGQLSCITRHCERDEDILSVRPRMAYLFEAIGAAVLGGVQPQPIDAAMTAHTAG